MAADRTVSAAQQRIDRIWDEADTKANLPDPDHRELGPDEAQALVAAFEDVRARARGRTTAPQSWLPAPATRVATTLSDVAAQADHARDWPTVRRMREAFVDLQAFLPDGDSTEDKDALDRVRWAQAIAISLLRDDERVVGAYNALGEIDIVIGEAHASLEAVDRYKESQASGIAAIVLWPISVIVGAVIGSFLWGLTLSAIASGVVLSASGLLIGPWYGWLLGGLSSRIDRRAMRSDRRGVVAIGRWFATGLWLPLFFGLPIVIGLGVAWVCSGLGLP